MSKPKNKAAVHLGRLRWKGTTAAERSEAARQAAIAHIEQTPAAKRKEASAKGGRNGKGSKKPGSGRKRKSLSGELR